MALTAGQAANGPLTIYVASSKMARRTTSNARRRAYNKREAALASRVMAESRVRIAALMANG